MAEILVIDDEENLRISMQLALHRAGHTCRLAETGSAGLAATREKLPDLIFVDVNLPDTNGLELMAQLKTGGVDVPVIVITGYGTISSAVSAMQQGAVDYIQKPLSMDEVVLAVERCLENQRMRNQLDAYREAQQRASDSEQLIARCPQMCALLDVANRIAALAVDREGELPTVLLLGDTGTGKEALARYIHHHSADTDKPFVQVNCTAVPESLFESELFGHESGAFTHAKSAKKGLFEMAEEGTLFLDEIGDMPLATQSKLLVAIESGRFRRLGGTAERVTRARVMAATNSNLEQKVERGEFRADLFYRLKVFCLELPRLCDRGEDVLLLADHFLRHYGQKFRKPALSFAPDARQAMAAYDWPGNVRELANVLQRTILLADSDTITADALNLQPRTDARAKTSSAAAGDGANPAFTLDFESQDCTLAAMESRLIDAALAHAQGNISEAARLLGVSRGSLRNRLGKRDG